MTDLKLDAERIFYAGIDAADAGKAVTDSLQINNQTLFVKKQSVLCLRHYKRIFIIGAGKAATFMAKAAAGIIGSRLTCGIIIGTTPPGAVKLPGRIEYHKGRHPFPDRACVMATDRIIRLLHTVGKRDLVVNLITGGGSSLLCAPAEGISLGDKVKATKQLLYSGASIDEINAVRKHISAIKGGLLAKHSGEATLITLTISDVIGNYIDVIASGPTAPDPTAFSDCLAIVQKYDLEKRMPSPVISRLKKGAMGLLSETPKPEDSGIFTGKYNFIIASNKTALAGAKNKALQLGYKTKIISNSLSGTPTYNAGIFTKLIRTNLRNGQETCLLSGGEMTLKVTGRGRGGRNQEFSLEMAKCIAGMKNVVVLSAGTDGIDGPTDAAGAIVDGQTLNAGLRKGLKVDDSLRNNNSYSFLKKTGNLLITGPLNTNVMDMIIILHR